MALVRRAQSELQNGTPAGKAPKSTAGVRPVALPAELVPELAHHRDDRTAARTTAGVSDDVHFHDLRHTGNTLARPAPG